MPKAAPLDFDLNDPADTPAAATAPQCEGDEATASTATAAQERYAGQFSLACG